MKSQEFSDFGLTRPDEGETDPCFYDEVDAFCGPRITSVDSPAIYADWFGL